MTMMDFDDGLGMVDVAFVIDTTGSMTPYLNAAKERVVAEAMKIAEAADLDIRYGLVEYRDHPPQDKLPSRAYQFADADTFQASLASLRADGGGDMPEAVFDGLLAGARELQWRDGADKILFLVGDAPAHNPCACRATMGGVVEVLRGAGLRVHAISLSPLCAADWLELAEGTGGEFEAVETAREATGYGTRVVGAAADSIGESRTFMAASASLGFSGARGMSMSSADVSRVSASLGWSAEEGLRTVNYMAARGYVAPVTPDDAPKSDEPAKP